MFEVLVERHDEWRSLFVSSRWWENDNKCYLRGLRIP